MIEAHLDWSHEEAVSSKGKPSWPLVAAVAAGLLQSRSSELDEDGSLGLDVLSRRSAQDHMHWGQTVSAFLLRPRLFRLH